MPSLIDLRRRIRSVKNTQQITRAMKMVAAARLRRAQDRALAARPYSLQLKKVITNMASRLGEQGHPLLAQREERRILLLVVTGDKGLCGAFNAQVIRQARIEIAKRDDIEIMTLGKRGDEFFKRRPVTIRKAYRRLFGGVEHEDAVQVASEASEAFTRREVDAVYVLFNEFASAISQVLRYERLLPLDAGLTEDGESATDAMAQDYIFEPSAMDILNEIVPDYVTSQIYRILLDSEAAFYASQMTAMESATKNAGELIDRLTLKYNRSRQAAITTELIEVVSGAQALEG